MLLCRGGVAMQGEKVDAVDCYLKADDFAQHTPDNHLFRGKIQNRIGDVNYMHKLLDNALTHYIQAIDFYRKADNKQSEVKTMVKIGNCYLLTNQFDSAFSVYERAEKLAFSIKDETMRLVALQNMGVSFMAEDMFTVLASTNRQTSAQLLIHFAAEYLNTDRPMSYDYGGNFFATMDTTDNSMLYNVY